MTPWPRTPVPEEKVPQNTQRQNHIREPLASTGGLPSSSPKRGWGHLEGEKGEGAHPSTRRAEQGRGSSSSRARRASPGTGCQGTPLRAPKESRRQALTCQPVPLARVLGGHRGKSGHGEQGGGARRGGCRKDMASR